MSIVLNGSCYSKAISEIETLFLKKHSGQVFSGEYEF